MKKPKARDRLKSSHGYSALGSAAAVLLLVAAGQTTATALPAQAATWQPPAATYTASAPVHTTVTMDDGVKIAVEVVYPTDPSTGARASGPFPVLLTQNPYGTQRSDPTDNGTYFVQRGYIYVASAVRGTGESGGQLDWFGDRQGKDGADLVDWAAHTLSGSNGKVGLDGCSYLGVNQWFTAAAVGKNSALKAITPFCTDSDLYNDLTANGGIPTFFVAGIAQAEPRGPEDDPATDPQSVTIAQQASGGSRSYDDAYWQALDVQKLMPRIVANNIPALSEAGWNDLFPGGNLGAYVAAQNAYYHRPLTDPIAPGEAVTGRYQAIVGPWTHGEHVNEATLQAIRLEWFDTWLKNAPTGMADTSTPLHLFENGASSWVDSAAWPLSSDARTYYLGDSSLTTDKPTGQGSDTLTWSTATAANTLTYTTAPLTRAALLDGPTDVTLYARSTTPETELSAKLSIVAPDGTVTKQADGILLGSQRALDTQESWYGENGTLLKPSHPFTQASQRPVTPGQTTRYDISLLSNFTRIPAGYRIRISIDSQPPADFHFPVAPTPQELANLAGGVYTVERSPQAASFVNLPLTTPSSATPSGEDWGPSS
ncbi:CocE/NonD family hydrolase [Streptomyces sp. W16]|uniref:CocE/NonD family hydrolase n=1 Tax=Streptomyces sp. W16 TaxID=3076631 RepID=UPI00295B3DD5|nr:CocE/NonD family hydrolase [Streptomyces sp. W16]MDV9170983.1 CocE/NonD family hydrolase [Streptomyces sp. W16]